MTISAQFFVSSIVILIVLHIILIGCAYLIFLERKVCAWAQDRIGPNRTNLTFGQGNLLEKVGLGKIARMKMAGFGQALADGLKLIVKEDYAPPHVDRILFTLAPALAVIPAMIGWAVIPWGGTIMVPEIPLGPLTVEAGRAVVAVAPLNIGVIYILAVGSMAVYGVVLAGYASNNKYSFLGGLRATAQMLSYEIPMGVCVLIMIMYFHTTNANIMVSEQAGGTWDLFVHPVQAIKDGAVGGWGIFVHPLLAIIFFTCVLAECNRAPFDLAEAEQELVGGFHTEYSSMRWAMFFLGEYMHMITGCAFFTVMFLGGWDIFPFLPILPDTAEGHWLWVVALAGLKFTVFALKVFLLLFIMMWIRWTLPRLRFDQLMKLAWRGLIPITIFMLLVTGVMVFLDAPAWSYFFANVAVTVGAMVIGPMLPKGPSVNRKIPLKGSRFSPLVESEFEPA